MTDVGYKIFYFFASSFVIFLSIVYATISFSATVNGTLGMKAVVGLDARLTADRLRRAL